MRYLKLFEAFDSNILTKTLGFIEDTKSRNDFMSLLKNTCESIDFPFSKLSDDYFEYLPFQKALEKADMTGDEPCEATSEREFRQYAVEGAKCEGGKIKRKWGSRIREVECPVCGGNGIKPKKPEIKLLKFWFDKDGKFVATTAVDGMVEKGRGKNSSVISGKTKFSQNINDYKTVKRALSFEQILSLKTGDIVYFTHRNQGSGVAYVLRSSGSTYLLQNFANGSTPGSSGWMSIAPHSWIIGSTSDYDRIDLLNRTESSEEEEEEVEIDPYTWNTTAYVRYGKISLRNGSIQDEIKNAHFAIILDFGKLKKSGYQPKSDIEFERKERRSGSLYLKSDEQVRKENIKRYMLEISKRSDIVSDASNVDRVAKRMLGGQYVLFLICGQNSRYYQRFTVLIDKYFDYLSSSDNKDYYLERINEVIKDNYEYSNEKLSRISNNVKETKKLLIDGGDNETYLEIVKKLEEISKLVWSKFSSIKLESIEDLEVFARKVESVRTTVFSRRYIHSRLEQVLSSFDTDNNKRAYNYLLDGYYTKNPEEILASLDILESMLNKLV